MLQHRLQALDDRDTMTPQQIVVIAICWIINMLDGFDVLAIAYTAPSISKEWAIGHAQLGVVFSAGLFGMILGAVLIAPIADRIGRRRIILLGLVITGSAMLATAWASSTTELMLARGVTGVGIACLLASLNTIVAEFSTARHRNFALGVFHTGYPIGATVGGFAAAALIADYSWRAVYIAGGCLTLVMIPLVLWRLPESLQFLIERRPPGALGKVNAVLARLGQPVVTELPERPAERPRSGIRELRAGQLRWPSVALWIGFFMSMITLYFLQSWMPQIVVDVGYSLEKGIYAGVALNAGGIVGMLLLGHASRSRSLRRLIVAFLVAGAAGMALFGVLAGYAAWLLALAFLLGMLVLGGFIGLYCVAALIYPTTLRATGVGWAIGIGRLGAIAGPALGGALMELDLALSQYFLILAAPLVIAAAATLTLRMPQVETPQ